MAQIHVPNEFFAKSKLEYSNWRWAFFRELIQNSYDAGATKMDFTFTSDADQDTHTVVCKDNGFGMSKDVIENVLLCLGGSLKPNGSVGGFGYAKSLLFFAHVSYEIRTKNSLVKGSGGSYVIEEAAVPTAGTLVKVVMKREGLQSLDFMQILHNYAKHLTVSKPLALSLNGLTVKSVFADYEYLLRTKLGEFKFRETDERNTYSRIVVSVRGLPMFVHKVYSKDGAVFEGLLELEGDTFDVLTANRDSLKSGYDYELTKIVQQMLEERSALKLGKSINIKLNYSAPINTQTAQESPAPVLEVQGEYVEIGALQQYVNVEYPMNFGLRLHNVVGTTARAKTVSDSIAVTEVLKLLKKTWVKSLAQEWKLAVYGVLATESLHERGVRYYLDGVVQELGAASLLDLDIDKGEFYVGQRRISAGFVLAPGIEGLNVKPGDGTDILIMCNPNCYDKEFLVGDLHDLAIHECAHLAVSGHNESFVDEDMKLRRSLRRRTIQLVRHRKSKKRG